MVNLPPRHEEKLAIEKCLRSFIIKSIHTIVQARNGIVCNTNCVSEVGARNNMMVYVEEDPEIGATIKQTLDANFPVHVQDLLSLEILAHWPKEPQMLMVVEVKTAGETFVMILFGFGYQLSRRQDPNEYQMCYTLRRGPSDLSRLGATPKSYQVGRIFSGLAIPQSPKEEQMSSTAPSSSSGSTPIDQKLTKLGSDTGLIIADGLLPVYLGTTVHYRTEIHFSSNNKLIPIIDGLTKGNLSAKNGIHEIFDTNGHHSVNFHALRNHKKSQKHVRVSETPIVKPLTSTQTVDMIRFEQSKLPCRVKPAFAVEQYESESDELFDPASQLLSKKSAERYFSNPCFSFRDSDSVDSNADNESSHTIDREVSHVKQDIEINEQHNAPIIDDIDIQELIKNLRSQYTSSPVDKESVSDDEDDDLISKQVPLQLPFSTFGVSGARLTHLFAELRERANLDLFQVPQINHTATNAGVSNNNSTTISPSVVNTAQSSLFDADALVDELERHERMLKEFDDFLSDFQNIEPFGIVRPTVTVPSDLPISIQPHETIHFSKPVIIESPTDLITNENILEFTCKAEANPKPLIIWYNATTSQPLEDKLQTSGYQTSIHVNKHLGKLMISNPVPGKSYSVYCNASNSIANEGTSVTLECLPPKGLPKPKISWIKDNKTVISQDKVQNPHGLDFSNLRIMPNGSLRIHPASIKDTGNYICVAMNPIGQRLSQPAYLRIKASPHITPKHIRVRQGQQVKLVCPTSNDKLIKWSRQSKQPFTISERIQQIKEALIINRVLHSDSDIYICTTLNGEQGEIHLTVETPPIFLKSPIDLILNIGDKAKFVCVANGNPKPGIYWELPDNTPIFPTDNSSTQSLSRHLVHTDGTLEIDSVTLKDAGKYHCIAHSSIDMIQTSAVLRIRRKKKNTTTTTTTTTTNLNQHQNVNQFKTEHKLPPVKHSAKSVNYVPPYIGLPPSNKTQLIGESVLMDCELPKLVKIIHPNEFQDSHHHNDNLFDIQSTENWRLSWRRSSFITHNNLQQQHPKEIIHGEDDRFQIFQSGTLQITDLQLNDSGQYTCSLRDDTNIKYEVTVTLNVLLTHIKEQIQEDPLTSPTNLQLLNQTEQSITLSWMIPHINNYDQSILSINYWIEIYSPNISNQGWFIIEHSRKLMISLNKLPKLINIQLAAYTCIGIGVKSELLKIDFNHPNISQINKEPTTLTTVEDVRISTDSMLINYSMKNEKLINQPWFIGAMISSLLAWCILFGMCLLCWIRRNKFCKKRLTYEITQPNFQYLTTVDSRDCKSKTNNIDIKSIGQCNGYSSHHLNNISMTISSSSGEQTYETKIHPKITYLPVRQPLENISNDSSKSYGLQYTEYSDESHMKSSSKMDHFRTVNGGIGSPINNNNHSVIPQLVQTFTRQFIPNSSKDIAYLTSDIHDPIKTNSSHFTSGSQTSSEPFDSAIYLEQISNRQHFNDSSGSILIPSTIMTTINGNINEQIYSPIVTPYATGMEVAADRSLINFYVSNSFSSGEKSDIENII
ncbi:putative cell adhesion molecule [Schistosoma mansoni]|uniref:putative cell adhesion molecule n=1 Tax=Schistosoma mansoni TaxID=6183 RepID=UPI00022DC2DE|nr:putative cell adhesion molecule [Schistosoma mansoni]|eukprot:XP_018652474.1 putative cell adhesion molecule [Schistosoma mansoni]